MQGPIARSDGEIPDNEFAAVMRHQGRQDALHDTFRGRRLHEGLVFPRATIGPPARTRLPAASDSSGFIRDHGPMETLRARTRAARDFHIARGRRGRSPLPERSREFRYSQDDMNPVNGLRAYAAAGGWGQTAGDYFEDEAETVQLSSGSGTPQSPTRYRSRSRERAPAARERVYVDDYACDSEGADDN